MPILFVSHSSKDAMLRQTHWRGRLYVNGFSSALYSPPKHCRWREVAGCTAGVGGTCRVVLCLVSQNWLSFGIIVKPVPAWYMERIIPLF